MLSGRTGRRTVRWRVGRRLTGFVASSSGVGGLVSGERCGGGRRRHCHIAIEAHEGVSRWNAPERAKWTGKCSTGETDLFDFRFLQSLRMDVRSEDSVGKCNLHVCYLFLSASVLKP